MRHNNKVISYINSQVEERKNDRGERIPSTTAE